MHWRQTRRKAIRQAGYRCQACGKSRLQYKAILQVHHLNYDNLGNEQEEDLLVLCKECHQKHHDKTSEIQDKIGEEKDHKDFWPRMI